MGGDAREDVGEPGLRIDAIHLRCDDETVHGRGSLPAAIGPAEQPGFSPQSHHPFILPMSDRSWKSITGGTRILAARSLSVGWNREPPGTFLKFWVLPASWSQSQGGCSIP